jgi:3-oxoacyl-(acyl-carrier-protein) synthase
LISGYTIIRNNTIFVDGKKVFSKHDSLENFLVAAYEHFTIDYPKFYKMDRLSKAGFLAAELLFREHKISSYAPEKIAVILANSNSSLDTDKRYLEASKMVPSPALFVYTLPNIVAGEICIRHKLKGENAFFVTERFDADLGTEYADMLFAGDSARACMAGWVDVLEEHCDVFLYLMEKKVVASASEETERIQEIYKSELWNN